MPQSRIPPDADGILNTILTVEAVMAVYPQHSTTMGGTLEAPDLASSSSRGRVLGKGNIERVVFIQDGLVSAILFYAQEHAIQRDDFLFQSRKGGHITKQRADQIIKTAASRASLRRGLHAHLFRHGYAINFLNSGGRLDALQEQLGHRDINTTRIYLRLSSEDVMREVAKIKF